MQNRQADQSLLHRIFIKQMPHAGALRNLAILCFAFVLIVIALFVMVYLETLSALFHTKMPTMLLVNPPSEMQSSVWQSIKTPIYIALSTALIFGYGVYHLVWVANIPTLAACRVLTGLAQGKLTTRLREGDELDRELLIQHVNELVNSVDNHLIPAVRDLQQFDLENASDQEVRAFLKQLKDSVDPIEV